ncbi:MAG: glycosyltransferase, partial [Planctomycetales bacterium]
SLPLDRFLPLPHLPSLARGAFKAIACRRVLREVERRSDVIILQLPFDSPLALWGAAKPRVYHLCADIREMGYRSTKYAGFKRPFAVAVGSGVDWVHRGLLRDRQAAAVANGKDLLRHCPENLSRSIVSGTIFDREVMSVKRSRPKDAPFRVLFVGLRLAEKGLEVLLDAYLALVRRVPDAELCIVGIDQAAGTNLPPDSAATLQRLTEEGAVTLMGHRKFGPELFQCYADADVIAVPSRSEGTPRVLVEARSFGCAAIGSRVGGIPSSIDHEVDGLLVTVGSSQELSESLYRVATDLDLRRRLIENGLARARRSTVEAMTDAILEQTMDLLAATENETGSAVAKGSG